MKQDNTKEIGKQAATLALVEIGLGSLLHAFKIPLSGHLLSINQIALISRSTFKLKSKNAPLQISLITALLKSLAPAGKKLTPMLAIAAQGLFYSIGIIFFGINYIGLLLAVLLSSIWAFVQPVLFIFLLFGKTSLDVVEYFLREFGKYIPQIENFFFGIILGLVLIKFVFAYIISITAIRLSDANFNKYQQKMLFEIKPKTSEKLPAIYMALKDLFNPLFLISFGMTATFFLFSNSELTLVQTLWALLRPLAIGFIIFYTIRVFPLENLSAFLERKGFTQLAKMLDIAITETRRL